MKTTIISVLIGSSLVLGATTPIDIPTACNRAYYDDPTYVPLGAMEEAIYAKRQKEVVYREANKGTNLFKDCTDSKGRIYSIELSELEYEQMKIEIHNATLPQQTVRRSLVDLLMK